MKKTLFVLLAVMLAGSMAMGQGFTLGPKIGYSASKISTNINDVQSNVQHNFMIGAFVRVGKKLYFQPEVMYHVRGGILDSVGGGQQTFKFKNLDVPILFGFKLLDLKVFNLRFMGGPVASFVLDKEASFNEFIKDPIPAEDMKDIIWGLDVGLGIDVLFLTLDVRYEFGLNNVYDGSKAIDMKNNLWTVGLGFKLF